MGQRREPRTETKLPVRIFGTDAAGKMFSENVSTLDVSREGARVEGVKAQIQPGEIVGVSRGTNRGRFAVKWVGQPGSPKAGQVGLQNLSPEKDLWQVAVPPKVAFDTYSPKPSAGSERRGAPRMKCSTSIQLHPDGHAAPIWGKALDLSAGGCFVEMTMPLPRNTRLKITLWLNQAKLLLTGRVMNSRPGFGVGIQFIEVSPADSEQLRLFIKSITQIPI